MSSAFIDSNVIIRYYAGDLAAKRVLESVLSGETIGYINSVINSVVFSEVLFVLIKLLTDMRAYELKKKPERIRETLRGLDKQITFLRHTSQRYTSVSYTQYSR